MNSSFKIIISMVLWGSLGLFVKNINLPSIEIAFLRAVIASTIFILSNLVTKKTNFKKYSKKNLIILFISGIAIGFNWVLLFQAYKFTTISNSTLSYYFAPVFVVLLSPIVLKQKLTFRKLLSVVGAMIGLFLILNNQSNVPNIAYNHIKGISYGLGAASLYASVMLFNNYIEDLSGFERTIIQLSAASLVLLPFILSRHELHVDSYKNLIFILIIGIVHTAMAYLLYFSALKDINVQNAAVLSYLDPISALIFSAIFLHESMGAWQIAGGILILFSAFAAENTKQDDKKTTEVKNI
ncbi:MAG: EamA/RhaT family transporter [Clostridium thermopalmarium]|uniref:DMT family transporter n=1 Tax=Clostridium thermopalmarium TaxID=29373 RepID=UPI00235607B7|nr:DMT family transporter [Clostridium thermopalmarium]MBE6044797.1 EamA/RhaT family transporter [Clostridium thermopalmarium]